MKKNLLLSLLTLNFLFLNSNLKASTTITAGNVSGTWTLAGSPYLVQGNITIADATILTIQPGVIVNFQGTFKLNVAGRLLAIGTATDTIIFTAAIPGTGWRGIRFDNTPAINDTSKIVYCKLQYGKATGSSPFDCGGALYFNNFSKAIIFNCCISNCIANGSGAGIYCKSSNPIVSNSTISNNQALLKGGGIYCESSGPLITNNTISNNTANCCVASSGGGIYSETSNNNLTITYNTISNNIASNGGGLYSSGDGFVSNNIISYNTASNSGGGLYSNGTGVISYNIISYNTATNSGGGATCFTLTNLSFTKNIISDNASTNGGGIYYSMPFGTFSDNIICNNTASSNGGGFYCSDFPNSSSNIINSTISNNSAANGGALYCYDASSPGFRNCILYGNTAIASGAEAFLNVEASDPNFYYCDVQGGTAAFGLNGNTYSGIYQNNIDTDPKFVSPSGGSGTGFNEVGADWSLQNNSPCINTGDPSGTNPATDIADNPRVTVCRVDMGAYEYQNGIPLTATISQTQQMLCYGDSTATATLIAAGGSGTYTYAWSTSPIQTGATAIGLKAATYTVTVTETSYSCSVTKTITIAQPQQIIFTPTPNPVLCKNGSTGSITGINALGGTGTFQYSKDSGLTYQSANIFAGLTAGTYKVVIKDGNNCVTPVQSIIITEPPLLTFTTTHGNVHCINGNSGNDTIIANGGTGTKQYSKDGGLTYQSSNIFTGLNANTYQIMVKDSNNCVAPVQNVIITPIPSATFTTQNESSSLYCDGSLKASLTGGTGTILPTWNTTPVQTTDSIGALCSGNYILHLIDANGCTNTFTQTIQAGSIPPTPPICMVTVDSTHTHNIVIWEKTNLIMTAIDSFVVYREIGTNNYQHIGAVSHDSLSTFDDHAANPASTGFRYKLKSKNAHGVESLFSDYHNTIYLTNTGGNFNWTPYQVENNTTPVYTYNVYRDNNSTGNFLTIGNTTGSQFGYTDINYSSFPNASYYVEAVMTAGDCHPTRSIFNASISNVKHFGTTGIQQLSNNSVIKIYPNPASNTLYITGITGKTTLRLYDIVGKLVLEKEVDNDTAINTSQVAEGIYMISTTSILDNTNNKVVISR